MTRRSLCISRLEVVRHLSPPAGLFYLVVHTVGPACEELAWPACRPRIDGPREATLLGARTASAAASAGAQPAPARRGVCMDRRSIGRKTLLPPSIPFAGRVRF
jgi:hypothetical protein